MLYQRGSFTVPASGKAPENCQHGWKDEKRNRCVFCGKPLTAIEAERGEQAVMLTGGGSV